MRARSLRRTLRHSFSRAKKRYWATWSQCRVIAWSAANATRQGLKISSTKFVQKFVQTTHDLRNPRRQQSLALDNSLEFTSPSASGQERTICARSQRRIPREATDAPRMRVSANRSPPPPPTTHPVALHRGGAEPNHPSVLRPDKAPPPREGADGGHLGFAEHFVRAPTRPGPSALPVLQRCFAR